MTAGLVHVRQVERDAPAHRRARVRSELARQRRHPLQQAARGRVRAGSGGGGGVAPCAWYRGYTPRWDVRRTTYGGAPPLTPVRKQRLMRAIPRQWLLEPFGVACNNVRRAVRDQPEGRVVPCVCARVNRDL